MKSHLLIVESPAKAKTLGKYLGAGFKVVASYGHVRDLVPKSGAVDVDHNFAMKYQSTASGAKNIKTILEAARLADVIYLATDPDREGEAIAWHIVEILKTKKALTAKTVKRLAFYEITQEAVHLALKNPRDILQTLVDAQQARRALDYLVGFNLSPLLWKKIRKGLSAGRVQSPALRLICEREEAIRGFLPAEYWTIHLKSHKNKDALLAKLIALQGKKVEQFDVPNEAKKASILDELSAYKEAIVSAIQKKQKTRNSSAPFTTSTLQQEASHKLGMTTDKTMRFAQQLYEGVDVGKGIVGLITYMRTDSVALANEAIQELRAYIQEKFEVACLPKKAVVFKNKSKNAQEAHEAIRPTSIYRTPEEVKPYLTQDQYRLYSMIWKRTLSCQMAPAIFDATTVDIALGSALFRATGQVLIFPSFLALYEEETAEKSDADNVCLPELQEQEKLPVDELYGEQHFTQPLPRFNEASLVKALEEYGIGRPSTYVSIISTLKRREYVNFEKKRFTPTDTGEVVNKFLTEHFSQYVDYHFTANLEDQLDGIANGERQWVAVLHDFWGPFSSQVSEKENLKRSEVTSEVMDEVCPECGKPVLLRLGRRGRFVGCSGYPTCRYTRSLNPESPTVSENFSQSLEGRSCPLCGGDLLTKKGPYSDFIGCSHYPKCKYSESLAKPESTGVNCPLCHQGNLVGKKSRRGKLFYSCSDYPKCTYALWDKPVLEACPACSWLILVHKTTKKMGTVKKCPQKDCHFSEPIDPAEA